MPSPTSTSRTTQKNEEKAMSTDSKSKNVTEERNGNNKKEMIELTIHRWKSVAEKKEEYKINK